VRTEPVEHPGTTHLEDRLERVRILRKATPNDGDSTTPRRPGSVIRFPSVTGLSTAVNAAHGARRGPHRRHTSQSRSSTRGDRDPGDAGVQDDVITRATAPSGLNHDDRGEREAGELEHESARPSMSCRSPDGRPSSSIRWRRMSPPVTSAVLASTLVTPRCWNAPQRQEHGTGPEPVESDGLTGIDCDVRSQVGQVGFTQQPIETRPDILAEWPFAR